MNTFLLLAAEKKDSKNGAARKFVGPSYFDPTLDRAVASYGVLKVVDTKYSRHFAYVLAQDQWFVWSKMIINVPWTQLIANYFSVAS